MDIMHRDESSSTHSNWPYNWTNTEVLYQ